MNSMLAARILETAFAWGLYHPVYHAGPPTPLRLRYDRGRLVDIGGDPLFAGCLRTWLDQLGDEGACKCPVHLSLGINPNALLTKHPEWERVMGSVTCGMGDLITPSTICVIDSQPLRRTKTVVPKTSSCGAGT